MKHPAPELLDRPYTRNRAGQSLVHAITADLLRYARRGVPLSLDEVLETHFSSDSEQRRSIEILTRADAVPATTTGSGWVNTLVQTVQTDFLVNLGGVSAGSTVLRRCLNFPYDRGVKVQVPDLITDPDSATFVAEGAPIPVRNFSFGSGKTLEPRALKVIVVFTREVLTYTGAEQKVRVAVNENVGLALDKAMFSTTAEVPGVSPAGLLVGKSALTVSSTTPLSDAIQEDLRDLISAVAPVAGNNPIILVAAPPQAVTLKLWFRGNAPYEVLSSSALADGTVIAVATNAVASVIDDALRFDVSGQAALVMTDVGSEISAATGGTSVVADPVRSMMQTDCVALRIRFGVNWALRNATGLAFMENVSW